MELDIKPKIDKYLKELSEPMKSRVKLALYKLSKEPPEGDIKKMVGTDSFRLRVGNIRIIFNIEKDNIIVHTIGMRGQVYKKGE